MYGASGAQQPPKQTGKVLAAAAAAAVADEERRQPQGACAGDRGAYSVAGQAIPYLRSSQVQHTLATLHRRPRPIHTPEPRNPHPSNQFES